MKMTVLLPEGAKKKFSLPDEIELPAPEKKKGKHDWIVYKYDVTPNEFRCERCGARYAMATPAPIDVMIAAMKAFAKPHKRCKENGDKK